LNVETTADGPTTAADCDAASRTVHLDSLDSGTSHVTAPREGRDLPTMPAPTYGESFDTSDPAAFILQINPPTAAHSSSPGGEHVAAEVEGTVTVVPPGDRSAVPTMVKTDDQASPNLRERPVPAIDGYEILGVLGRGGMGVVYRARQVLLNRPCAVKMILAGAHAGAPEAVRFHAEAEAIARLQHPNIIQIHHIGEADGLPYFELEYVDGGSLDKLLDGAPWPARRAAALVELLARGVAEAHRQGIVHRDLKPGNVLMTADGTPKIGDFGVAKALNTDTGLTATNSILGSPGYMAPEQAEGNARQVGPLADVYALGAILYEVLTGRPPFRGATILETLEQARTAEPVSPRRLLPRLPRDIETIALKCLRKDPAKRYDSASALGEDLHRFLSGEPIVARPVSPWERAARWARRKPAMAALGAALLVAVASLLGLGAWSYHQIKQSRDSAVADSYRALLGETRAVRLARRPGWREITRTNLRRLAALDTPERNFGALRNEAVAGVGQLDVRLALRLSGHEHYVYGLDFSPDGLTLASSGFDGRLCLWDLTSGRLARSVLDPTAATADAWTEGAPMPAARFRPGADPAGRYLAYTTRGQSVQTLGWRGAPAPFASLTADAQPRDLAFDRAGGALAVSWSDGNVRLHDAATGALWRIVDCSMRGSREFYRRIALDPAGNRLATEGPDHAVQVFDVQSDAPPRLLGRHRGTLRGLAFSPDGHVLATASEDRSAKLWDVETGQELLTLQGHMSKVVCLDFSPDGRLIATAGDDETLRLWDAETGQPLMVLEPEAGNLQSVAFSPDGRRLAAACTDIVVYELTGGGRRSLSGRGYWVRDLAFHPSEPLLAAKTRDPEVVIWDLTTRLERRPYKASFEAASLAFSPDGRHLAITPRWRFDPKLDGPPLLLLNAETGGRQAEFAGVFFCNTCFDPVGARLATGEVDGTVRVRDVASGRVLCEVKHTGTISGLAFLDAGRQLVVTELGGSLISIDPNDGRLIRRVVFPGGITSFVPAPDGARIAVVDLTGRVRIADLPGFEIAAELPRDDVSASASGFEIVLKPSGDGRWLATGADHRVTLWNARTLRKRFDLLDFEGMVLALGFAPDCATLAVGGGRELISLIDLPSIGTELADLGLDWSEPGTAAILEARPGQTFRHVRWPSGFSFTDRFILLGHALELEPNQPELAMELAWLYVTAPDHARDPDKALPFARRATELASAESLCWTTLALVDYRLGQWRAAAEEARRSIRLSSEGASPYDWLILAMCEHQLRQSESAHENLERANWRIADRAGKDTPPAADLRELLAEAEALLGGSRPGNSTDRGR
jgi:serine/threonine protein kinase/WD40 repeat protein